MVRRLLLTALCVGLASPALAQSSRRNGGGGTVPPQVSRDAGRPGQPLPEYRIGPEDVLDISVWKSPELSRSVPVRPDGRISLPLVHEVTASGLTPSALRDELAARLSEFITAPDVSVIVREVHSAKVSVIGAVRTPGRYEINSAATVLELLALAQGFTDFAAKDRIVVLRSGAGAPRRIPFDYTRIADGSGQENFLLEAGDIIVVPGGR